jgi:hypothetical protein
MVGKITKLSTTFVFNTFSDSAIKLVKNRDLYQLFSKPKLRSNIRFQLSYLPNQNRYKGAFRCIGKIMKSIFLHKNFTIFTHVDLEIYDKEHRLFQETDTVEIDKETPTTLCKL